MSGPYSSRLLLGEVESLIRIHYQGKIRDIVSEVSKSQREILGAFSLDANTLQSLGVLGAYVINGDIRARATVEKRTCSGLSELSYCQK